MLNTGSACPITWAHDKVLDNNPDGMRKHNTTLHVTKYTNSGHEVTNRSACCAGQYVK